MLLANDPTDDDPDSTGHDGNRTAAWGDPDALPLAEAVPPEWCFRCGLYGHAVPVQLCTDGDGVPDTSVTVSWRAGEGESVARPLVTDVRPLRGCRTRYSTDRHEAMAIARSRVGLTCSRLKETA